MLPELSVRSPYHLLTLGWFCETRVYGNTGVTVVPNESGFLRIHKNVAQARGHCRRPTIRLISKDKTSQGNLHSITPTAKGFTAK
jgi:hypothetical protein